MEESFGAVATTPQDSGWHKPMTGKMCRVTPVISPDALVPIIYRLLDSAKLEILNLHL